MENNRIEIDRIRREIKAFEIDRLPENVSLIDRLDSLHESIEELNNIIDSVDQDVALRLTISFRDTHFRDLDSFNEVPLELNSATPSPLFKLHISTLEAFLIRQKRLYYAYHPGDRISFDTVTMHISANKTIINKGEKLSGQLILVGTVNFDATKKIIKKMTLNGQEITAAKDGWRFEIEPDVSGTGLTEYELKCEAVLDDSTTLKGRHIIYVRN
jgi:hypothetical protein